MTPLLRTVAGCGSWLGLGSNPIIPRLTLLLTLPLILTLTLTLTLTLALTLTLNPTAYRH